MNAFVIISAALTLAEQLLTFASKVKQTASQDHELTPVEERELDDRLEQLFQQSHWKTEP